MAIWKELAKWDSLPEAGETPAETHKDKEKLSSTEAFQNPRRQTLNSKETIIGAGLAIEGKIEGDGDVRIAGSFKGDVSLKGSLTIESGASISGEISADNVTVGGQVEGNVSASTHVNLLESCQLVGDLKATSLTVAAGSRMRGRVEFGWDGQEIKKIEVKKAVEKVANRSAL